MNIAIDLDNTMVDLRAVEDVSIEMGLKYRMSDVMSWGYKDFPSNFVKKIYQKFSDPSYMCNLEPFDGVNDKLKEWKFQGHELTCITCRNPLIRKATENFVAKLFPEIDFTNFINGISGLPGSLNESKISHLILMSADVLIDDGPHYIIDALNHNIRCFMISNNDTKYNHMVPDHPLLTRVEKLTEIIL